MSRVDLNLANLVSTKVGQTKAVDNEKEKMAIPALKKAEHFRAVDDRLRELMSKAVNQMVDIDKGYNKFEGPESRKISQSKIVDDELKLLKDASSNTNFVETFHDAAELEDLSSKNVKDVVDELDNKLECDGSGRLMINVNNHEGLNDVGGQFQGKITQESDYEYRGNRKSNLEEYVMKKNSLIQTLKMKEIALKEEIVLKQRQVEQVCRIMAELMKNMHIWLKNKAAIFNGIKEDINQLIVQKKQMLDDLQVFKKSHEILVFRYEKSKLLLQTYRRNAELLRESSFISQTKIIQQAPVFNKFTGWVESKKGEHPPNEN